MAIRYPRGGSRSVPKETLRYINRALDGLVDSTNEELREFMPSGDIASRTTIVTSAGELPSSPMDGDLIYVTTPFSAAGENFVVALYVRQGGMWRIAAQGAVTNITMVTGFNGSISATSGVAFLQASNAGAWPTSTTLPVVITFTDGTNSVSATVSASINASGEITASTTMSNADITITFTGNSTGNVEVNALHTSGAGYSFVYFGISSGAQGTDGVSGLPAVSSNFPYNRRQADSSVDASGEYSLRVSATGAEATTWAAARRITFNPQDNNMDFITAVLRAVRNGGTHVRVWQDDDNWGWYLITASTAGVFTISPVDSRGTPPSTAQNTNVFIGFDAAVGEQGDSAFAANLVLSPNSISQNADGTYPTDPVAISVVFANEAESVPVNIGNATVASDGTITFPAAVSDQAITIGTGSFQYDVSYSGNTVSVQLETTTGTVVASESETLTLASAGSRGPTGAPAINIVIEARMRPAGVAASSLVAPNTVDPADWDFAPDGLAFRNSDGATRTLVAFVQIGGVTQDLAAHQGYTYAWTRNGAVWTPSITGVNRMSRWIPIDANDVDGFSDQFIVDVDNIL